MFNSVEVNGADDVEIEASYQRAKFDKNTGDVITMDIAVKVDVEYGVFDEVDAGSGEQFMAVKPWIGAVVEP